MSDVLNENELVSNFSELVDCLDELLQEFKDSSAKQISEVKRSIQDKDAKSLEISSHSLKGASANFYSLKLKECCFEIEKLSRDSKFEEAKIFAEQLERLNQEFIQELERVFNKMKST